MTAAGAGLDLPDLVAIRSARCTHRAACPSHAGDDVRGDRRRNRRELFFKCENLQHVGAFKARGACNAVFSLDADEAERGVVTHSSGNHGAALAYAARRRGIPAWVVMPENAPAVKQANVRRFGATVRLCAPTVDCARGGVRRSRGAKPARR